MVWTRNSNESSYESPNLLANIDLIKIRKITLLTKTCTGSLELVLKAEIMVFMTVASQIIFTVECLSTLPQIAFPPFSNRPLADRQNVQRRRHDIHVVSLSMNG